MVKDTMVIIGNDVDPSNNFKPGTLAIVCNVRESDGWIRCKELVSGAHRSFPKHKLLLAFSSVYNSQYNGGG